MQKPPGAILQESASSAPVYARTGDVMAITALIAIPKRKFPICPSLAAAAAGTLVVHKKGGRVLAAHSTVGGAQSPPCWTASLAANCAIIVPEECGSAQ